MDERHIRALLKRYGSGKCTEEEKKLVDQWYAEHSIHQHTEIPDAETLSNIKDQTWLEVKQNIRNNKGGGKGYTRWIIGFSAAAALVIFAGIIMHRSINKPTPGNPLQYFSIQSGKAQVKEVKLPDGTLLWLNAESSIRYASTYNTTNREVFIDEGEVYFDVAHDTSRPFIVTARGIKTTVLGTAFNIRSYHYLDQFQVSVTRGKVSVSDNTEQVGNAAAFVLQPDEQLTIDARTHQADKRRVKSIDFTTWRQGIFQFNDEKLSSIVKMIEHKFGTRSRFKQERIGDLRFTAGFKPTDELADILDNISIAGNLSYYLKDKEIIFSFKKQKSKN